jgi:hypothetical protein
MCSCTYGELRYCSFKRRFPPFIMRGGETKLREGDSNLLQQVWLSFGRQIYSVAMMRFLEHSLFPAKDKICESF